LRDLINSLAELSMLMISGMQGIMRGKMSWLLEIAIQGRILPSNALSLELVQSQLAIEHSLLGFLGLKALRKSLH
jgi:hypothetical protein